MAELNLRPVRLRGHYDGHVIVLDEPAPPDLPPNTAVEIVLLATRDQIVAEWRDFLRDWWQRPLPTAPARREWTREDLYERG